MTALAGRNIHEGTGGLEAQDCVIRNCSGLQKKGGKNPYQLQTSISDCRGLFYSSLSAPQKINLSKKREEKWTRLWPIPTHGKQLELMVRREKQAERTLSCAYAVFLG